MIWAVYNGFIGNGMVAAIVEADTEQHAFEQAVNAFAADDKRPNFSTPSPDWSAEIVTLPYVCELS